MSLQTKEPAAARFLVAHMDATFEAFFMTTFPADLDDEEMKEFFRLEFERNYRKFNQAAAISRTGQFSDPASDELLDHAMGWAYRLVAKRGVAAKIGDADRIEMRKRGLNDANIDSVEQTLVELQASGMVNPNIANIRSGLEQLGVDPSAANIANAHSLHHRALAEALLRTEGRYEGRELPFEEIIAELLNGAQIDKPSANQNSQQSGGPALREAVADATPRLHEEEVKPINEALVQLEQSILAIGEALISKNRSDGNWDTKTGTQAQFIYAFFDKFLRERFDLVRLSELRQRQVYDFDVLMREMFASYGKSPKHRLLTIDQIRSRGLELPPPKRGLSGQTRNRHFTMLGNLFREAKNLGIKMDRDISLSELRASKSKRARNQIRKPKAAEVEELFHTTIFTGCEEWDALEAPGANVYHRAAYFGTMLAHYQGMRRDEFCG